MFKSMVWPPPMSIRRTPTSEFGLTPIRLISGVMMLSVNLVTNAVNAVPMTTAVARSTILPRERNSLNPLNMGMSFLRLSAPGTPMEIIEQRREFAADHVWSRGRELSAG